MSQPLFSSAPLEAYHGKVVEWVDRNPKPAVLILAVLVLLVIILLFTTYHYHSEWKKAVPAKFRSGFTGPHGSWTGGMHSNWQNGSVHDQAYFGDGFQHYSQLGSTYQPAVTSKNALRSQMKGNRHMHIAAKRAAVHRAAVKRMQALRRAARHREGLDPGPEGAHPPPCSPSEVLDAKTGLCFQAGAAPTSPYGPLDPNTGYEGDEGGDWVYDPSLLGACPTTGTFDPVTGVMSVDTQNIGQVWDPDAIAEAQALASVGSYVNDPEGDEMAFQAAINSSYDANAAADTMNDAQLSRIMAGGSAP